MKDQRITTDTNAHTGSYKTIRSSLAKQKNVPDTHNRLTQTSIFKINTKRCFIGDNFRFVGYFSLILLRFLFLFLQYLHLQFFLFVLLLVSRCLDSFYAAQMRRNKNEDMKVNMRNEMSCEYIGQHIIGINVEKRTFHKLLQFRQKEHFNINNHTEECQLRERKLQLIRATLHKCFVYIIYNDGYVNADNNINSNPSKWRK